MSTLYEQRTAALDRAETIARKAKSDGRDFTDAEVAEVDQLSGQIERLDERIAKHERTSQLVSDLAAVSPGASVQTTPQPFKNTPGAPSGGLRTAADPGPFAKAAMNQMEASVGAAPDGSKQIAPSGSLTLPIDVGMVAASRPEFSLVPYLQQQPLEGASQFTYLRQTERNNNPAVVAVGEQKPTSTYGMDRVTDQVATIAHLSEPIPRQYLADFAGLQQFLSQEMSYGIRQETDRIVVNGSGSDEEPAGILNTTGVLAQGHVGDALRTARAALTRLQEQGEAPTVFVFRPGDWEQVETQRDANERYMLAGAPSSEPARRLWSVPVVLSTEVPSGTALVGDLTEVTLFVREGIRLDWSEAGPELFDRNAVKFRAETRLGLAVKRPSALCTVELVAE